MNMENLITALNELDKLKMLLFDDYQYCIFEHIPRPYLFDAEAARRTQETEEMSRSSSKTSLKKCKKKMKKRGEILMSNTNFWGNDMNEEEKLKNFNIALDHIKKRSDNNVIDRRLLEILMEKKFG